MSKLILFQGDSITDCGRNREDKHFVISYEEAAGGKLRKYYSLTTGGRSYLRDKKKEWQEYSDAVNNVLGGVGFEGI